MKKIIAAGGLVLNKKDDLLMIFRRGFWDLPKGKVDEGESVETCAIREVEEETGLKNIELIKFMGITNHEYFDKYSQQDVQKETHWFLMKVNSEQKFIPQTEEDITEIKWIVKNEWNDHLKKSYENIAEIIKKYQDKLH
ncbi:MAG: NUDIX hydrolase [Chitinophagaceae bacterium]